MSHEDPMLDRLQKCRLPNGSIAGDYTPVAPQDDRYVVERYPSFADDKTMLCVMDKKTGRMLGGQLLPTIGITVEDEAYILSRIRRDIPQPARPDLKLVG